MGRRPPIGTRPLDPVRSRLGLFRGGADRYDTLNEAPEPANPGPITQAFYRHRGRVAHKWHHYLPLYDRYFAPYRGLPVRFLEIGVAEGGSLELWRGFFGSEATIFGIDLNPACQSYDGEAASIRIGSQADPAFLRAVVAEMGGIDIVLDDGSHEAAHQRASFDALFPLLADGGIYVIEDLHTAYWANFGGGYRKAGSAIELVKTLIDDMHHWYHPHGELIAGARSHVGGVHAHDSLVVIDKQSAGSPPVKSFRGGEPLARKA